MESPAGSVSDPKALILKEVNFIAFLIFNLNLTVCTVSGLAEQLSAGTTLEHEEDMGQAAWQCWWVPRKAKCKDFCLQGSTLGYNLLLILIGPGIYTSTELFSPLNPTLRFTLAESSLPPVLICFCASFAHSTCPSLPFC